MLQFCYYNSSQQYISFKILKVLTKIQSRFCYWSYLVVLEWIFLHYAVYFLRILKTQVTSFTKRLLQAKARFEI
jgi:hypothetical protein